MHITTRLVVMLAPLILLSGCARRQPAKHFNKKQLSHHLTEETADVSKTINNVRVNCKQSPYIKKADCTLIHMTIDNKSDSICFFNRSDIKFPLLSQKEAAKAVKGSGFRKTLRIILPTTVGVACGAAIVDCLLVDHYWALGPPFTLLQIICGAALATGTYFITKALVPDKRNMYGLHYIHENNAHMSIFPHETKSMLVLVKGQLNQKFEISLQTDNGPLDYNFGNENNQFYCYTT